MARTAKAKVVTKPRPDVDPKSNIKTSMLDMDRGELEKLPIEVLYELQNTVENEIAVARKRKETLDTVKHTLFHDRAVSARHARNKDHGVIHLINLPADGSDAPAESMVVCEGRKTVKWNQDLMLSLRIKMLEASDNPDLWMSTKTEYWVPEVTFENWTEAVKAVFRPARTVVIKEDFTIELIDEKP